MMGLGEVSDKKPCTSYRGGVVWSLERGGRRRRMMMKKFDVVPKAALQGEVIGIRFSPIFGLILKTQQP